MSVTLSYTDLSSVVLSVSVKGPALGNQDMQDRFQKIGDTLGGQLYVYTIGDARRSLTIALPNLDNTERGNVEHFFSAAQVNQCARRWTLTLAPTWPEVLRADGSVSTALVADGAYNADQKVVLDTVTYDVRLLDTSLQWTESINKLHDLTMRLRVLEGPLPANT
jgi:hypothetical protein